MCDREDPGGKSRFRPIGFASTEDFQEEILRQVLGFLATADELSHDMKNATLVEFDETLERTGDVGTHCGHDFLFRGVAEYPALAEAPLVHHVPRSCRSRSQLMILRTRRSASRRSCPQAASISRPRRLRIVTLMPSDRNRSRNARTAVVDGAFQGNSLTGL